MKKDILDNFTKEDLFELLLRINEKINYIQDETINTRELCIKLYNQNNALIKFMASLEVTEVSADYESSNPLVDLPDVNEYDSESMYKLVKSLLNGKEELKEFEKELEKNKLMLTPGQVGES